MFNFLLKGIIRDRHRSLFPIIIVTLGVSLTVLVYCWVNGILGDMIAYNARYLTGHVKIITRAYEQNMDQMPIDLALGNINELKSKLQNQFPNMNWVERIRFGGLLDAPDENGETRAQGPAFGLAVNLFSKKSREVDRLNIKSSLVKGRIPSKTGEIIISDELADKLDVAPGSAVTILTSTMYGSMAMQNYMITGTVRFGVAAMDRGAIIMDISDAKYLLNMEDAASEILGYFPNGLYKDKKATEIKRIFNHEYENDKSDFAPVMLKLKDQNDMASMLDYISKMINIFIFVFITAMSIVLWNAGLLGGLRRYGEMGLRLAIGEDRTSVYRSLIYESIMIGVIGSVFGTLIGLMVSYYLQEVGIDFTGLMQNSSIMVPAVYRARITPPAFYLGFIPGVISTVIGTMLSGIGIYRRKTAQLFKELET
ncbi:MAG: FtsX-like permease family protein [Calditrichaceae bacterium]|jgi:putative ABC transport system permease protein